MGPLGRQPGVSVRPLLAVDPVLGGLLALSAHHRHGAGAGAVVGDRAGDHVRVDVAVGQAIAGPGVRGAVDDHTVTARSSLLFL